MSHSEGLNLRDATRLINYDIHWNPVRLMQRIGRIDRRMDRMVEDRIVEDHPNQKPLRGEGDRGFPVFHAGHTFWHRPHSVQE